MLFNLFSKLKRERLELLREDYLHPLTVSELITILSKLPDKTKVMTLPLDELEEQEVYVVEFQKNPPKVFLA